MKRKAKNQELLEDILSPDSLRDDQLLNATLKAVRTRRAVRRGQRIATILLLVLGAIGLPWRLLERDTTSDSHAVALVTAAPKVIHTAPMPVAWTVSTRSNVVSIIQSSGFRESQMATTRKSPALRCLSDEALLLLAETQGAMLVRENGISVRLLFPTTVEFQ